MEKLLMEIPMSRKKVCEILGTSRSKFIEAEKIHNFKKYYLTERSRIPHYKLSEIITHFHQK